jgi:hypothetical protein
MSDPHAAHGHEEGHHGPAAVPFSEDEWTEFQENDKHAAATIVLLMTCIFLTGLALYTLVAVAAAG